MRRWLAIALVASTVQAGAVDPANLLEPQDAFRLSAQAIDDRIVQIDFRIAPGYYLYRDRFRFETKSGKSIANAVLPPGKMKVDQFFGRTQIYRDHVSIKVPRNDAGVARKQIMLKITSQGCADVGVCDIPQEQWVDVTLDRSVLRSTP